MKKHTSTSTSNRTKRPAGYSRRQTLSHKIRLRDAEALQVPPGHLIGEPTEQELTAMLTRNQSNLLEPTHQRHGIMKNTLMKDDTTWNNAGGWGVRLTKEEQATVEAVQELMNRTGLLSREAAHQQVRQELTPGAHPASLSSPMTQKLLMDQHQMRMASVPAGRQKVWTKLSESAELDTDYIKHRQDRQKQGRPEELTKLPEANSTTSSEETRP